MPRNYPVIFKGDENKPPQKTNVPRIALEKIFSSYVMELIFKRRIYPAKRFTLENRRMLCTSNFKFISNPNHNKLFKWKKPVGRRGASWYRQRGLLIVWDILKNDWRMVSLDDYMLLGFMPIRSDEDQAKFIAFYREHLKYMRKSKRFAFDNK